MRSEFNRNIEGTYRDALRPRDDRGQSTEGKREEPQSRFENLLEENDELYVLFRSAGISATYLSVIASFAILEVTETGEEVEVRDEQVATIAFFSRLASDLWAIIELVERGYDLQARALARSFLEHIDVLICCINDRELTAEFVRSGEPKKANEFWHKHISKSRSKARVSAFISEMLGLQSSDIVGLLREDVDFSASSLLHPTIAGGIATAFGVPDEDYEAPAFFPQPTAASVGTLRAVLIHLWWLDFAMGSLPLNGHGAWRAPLQGPSPSRFITLAKLDLVRMDMFLFLLDHEILVKREASEENSG